MVMRAIADDPLALVMPPKHSWVIGCQRGFPSGAPSLQSLCFALARRSTSRLACDVPSFEEVFEGQWVLRTHEFVPRARSHIERISF